jgi:hypothetical protein
LDFSEENRFMKESLFKWGYRANALLIALCAVLALPAISVSLGLAAEADAVDYRVPLLKWILRHHTWPSWNWTMVDDYPSLGEILMIVPYGIRPGLARIVPLIASFALAAFGASIGLFLAERLHDQKEEPPFFRKWIWTTVFVLTLGFRPVAVQMTLLMTDGVATAFLGFSLWMIFSRRWNAAGVGLAFAAASKMMAWPAIAAILLALLLSGWASFSDCARLGLWVLIGILPMGVRNFIVNDHQIFFPFLVRGPLGQKMHQLNAQYSFQYGRGHGFVALLLLPFDLLITNSFVRPLFDYSVGVFFVVNIGLASFFALLKRGLSKLWRLRGTRFLICFILIDTLLWFLSAQQLRFLEPALIGALLLSILILLEFRQYVILQILALCVFTTATKIQKEPIFIALGRQPIANAAEVERVRPCLSRIPSHSVVGHSARDGLLGYFDYDFVFLPPHPYAIPDAQIEKPDYIYGQVPKQWQDTYQRVTDLNCKELPFFKQAK